MPLSSTSVENCTLKVGNHSFPLPKFSTKITIWELKQIIKGATGVYPIVLFNSAYIDEGSELHNNMYVRDCVTHGDTLIVVDPPDIQQNLPPHPPPQIRHEDNREDDVTITIDNAHIQQHPLPHPPVVNRHDNREDNVTISIDKPPRPPHIIPEIRPDHREDNVTITVDHKRISDYGQDEIVCSEQMFHVISIICCLLSLVCYITEFIPALLICCCCQKFRGTDTCLFKLNFGLHFIVTFLLLLFILILAPFTLCLSLFLIIFLVPYFVVLFTLGNANGSF